LRLLSSIHIRFGLPARTPAELQTLIKRADAAAAFYEATQLAGFGRAEALKFFGSPPRGIRTPRLAALAPGEAQAQFLARFKRLAA
jgi:5'-nucleotidase